jgi:hypothetical protein
VAIENARLYAEARRQQQWLRATAEVTQRLLSGDQRGEVLDLVTSQALGISGADLVVLALPAGDRNQLVIEHACGDGAAEALGLVLPAEGSASGIVMASGTPLAIDDFSGDARVAQVAREHIPLGPAVLVPLGPGGDVRGVLTAGRHQGALPLPPAAVEMLITFAAQAGIGLELAEHRSDAQRLVLFEDRDRIARDLHDLVIQRLFATGMSLQGTTAMMSDPEVMQRVEKAVDALDETIREIRSAIFSLQSRGVAEHPAVRGRILGVVEEMTIPRLSAGLRWPGSSIPGAPPSPALAALRGAGTRPSTRRRAGWTSPSKPADLVLTVGTTASRPRLDLQRTGVSRRERRTRRDDARTRVVRHRLEWRVPRPGTD